MTEVATQTRPEQGALETESLSHRDRFVVDSVRLVATKLLHLLETGRGIDEAEDHIKDGLAEVLDRLPSASSTEEIGSWEGLDFSEKQALVQEEIESLMQFDCRSDIRFALLYLKAVTNWNGFDAWNDPLTPNG